MGPAPTIEWVRLTDSNGLNYDPGTGLQVGPGTVAPGGTGTVGTPGVLTPTNFYPYRGGYQDARVLYLYRASLLTAAGLRAGPITQLEFNIATKSSTQPYSNFAIQLSNTAATTVPTTPGTIGAMTLVHTSTHTTVAGWNAHAFNAGSFSWDGTSNLLVQVCFDNTTATTSDQPYVTETGYVAAYGLASSSGDAGCSMTTGNGGDASPNTAT